MYKAMWCGAVRKKVMMLTRHTAETHTLKTKVNVQRMKEMRYAGRCLLVPGLLFRVVSSDPPALSGRFSAIDASLTPTRRISLTHLSEMKRRMIHSIPDQIVAIITPGAPVPTQNRMLMMNMTAQREIRRKPYMIQIGVMKTGSE